MAFRFGTRARMTCQALAAAAWLAAGAGAAAAQAQQPAQPAQPAQATRDFSARYSVWMTYLVVGEMAWTARFSDQAYGTAARGKASGLASVLISGEGEVHAQGAMAEGRLVPATVTSTIQDDDGDDHYTLDVSFENGAVKKIDTHGAAKSPDRKPVTPAMLRGVSDPLTAMLMPVAEDAFAAANCNKTLKVFDGRRRYDLVLSYKRLDTFKVKRGYAGKVLVCGVVLKPLGGYHPDSRLVKYLAGKSDLELWFAPIKGVALVAPVRAVMPTVIGTLEIYADAFEAGAAKPK